MDYGIFAITYVIGAIGEAFYAIASIQGTHKEKHLLQTDSHWKGFTAAHIPRLHRHHTHGDGVPFITWRTASMACMVSMGGMIFGYDTGLWY